MITTANGPERADVDARAPGDGLSFAVVDLRNGTILGAPTPRVTDERLQALAAAVPEVLATDRISWELVFGRLRQEGERRGLQDVIFVSRAHVYVALRVPDDESLVLVGVADRSRGVGCVMSEARAALTRIGREACA